MEKTIEELITFLEANEFSVNTISSQNLLEIESYTSIGADMVFYIDTDNFLESLKDYIADFDIDENAVEVIKDLSYPSSLIEAIGDYTEYRDNLRALVIEFETGQVGEDKVTSYIRRELKHNPLAQQFISSACMDDLLTIGNILNKLSGLDTPRLSTDEYYSLKETISSLNEEEY